MAENGFPPRNTVAETLAILKISRPTFYERVKHGQLKITKDGGRTFVSGSEIARYLAACEVAC